MNAEILWPAFWGSSLGSAVKPLNSTQVIQESDRPVLIGHRIMTWSLSFSLIFQVNNLTPWTILKAFWGWINWKRPVWPWEDKLGMKKHVSQGLTAFQIRIASLLASLSQRSFCVCLKANYGGAKSERRRLAEEIKRESQDGVKRE